jgi:crotonobetainyl-CoA:carnitine CoA-transferase CaiB-like acyl-CoA transferase
MAGEHGALFAALNRGKRSAELDLRSEPGASAVRRLAERADVLVESFRPGVMERRGLGVGTLLAANPRLVYCSIDGFAATGPNARRAGHDVGYAALSGFLAGTRGRDGAPVLSALQTADMSGALFATCAILAALLARERTGRGQHVEVPLADSAAAIMTVPLARVAAGGDEASELMGTHACYNVYRCRDGRWLAVGALEAKFWEILCGALELPHLAARQWADEPARGEAVREVAAAFARRDRDEWRERLSPLDVCVEPVLEMAEVPSSSLPWARAWPAGAAAVPALGEHTDAVLAEVGFVAGTVA